MKIRLYIDNLDQTGTLLQEGWRIDANAYGTLDNASFALDDPTNALSLTRGKEVIIEDYDDPTTRFFGGVLVRVAGQTVGLGRRWSCKALDWTFLLDRSEVSQEYRGKSDRYIISEPVGPPKGIFADSSTDLSDFDVTTHVAEGVENTQFMQFKNDSLRDILDTLADISGHVWYVDSHKRLHYKSRGAEAHPFYLSDAPDFLKSFPYGNIQLVYDISKVVNLVVVEGAFLRQEFGDIDEEDRTFKSDGVNRHTSTVYLWTARAFQTRIQVFRNTGTDAAPVWTEQTVGLAGQDDLGLDATSGTTVDVLWDPIARTLEWQTAPSNLAKSFRIDGDRLRGLIHEEKDVSSIARFGRVYAHSIKDVTMLSEEQVIARAKAELDRRKGEAERVSLRTTKDGLVAGQTIGLLNTTLGIGYPGFYDEIEDEYVSAFPRNYLVEKVQAQLLGGELAHYQVTLRSV